MYAFQLWREYKLSLAEIYALFPETRVEYIDEHICILDSQDRSFIISKLQHMWGTIKCIELLAHYRWKVWESIMQELKDFEWKFRYGLSIMWDFKNLKGLLMETKKLLKEQGISTRFVNKDFKNLSSAQILWEKLVARGTDFTLIVTWDKTQYFWKTIWVQDIESYSSRDYGKTRDMEVGMLPPKLAQIMIHLANFSQFSHTGKIKPQIIYDPFCWLGTVLIESILMWNSEVYGSDISANNIEKTKANIEFVKYNFKNTLKKSELHILDAREITKFSQIKHVDAIVTEWYLGQIFQKYSITEKKLELEKQQLLDIYTLFFEWLKKLKFQGNIVICFPFWDIKWKYFYFSEIYAIIEKYCNIQTLLPKNSDIRPTKSWSLLYKREWQIVGREIFKLQIK